MLEELGIDEEQKKKLEEKIEEVRKEVEKKIKEIRKEAEDDILSVLTSEQRKMFREKIGETFDFGSDRDPGFRRRGGGEQQRVADVRSCQPRRKPEHTSAGADGGV